ncbi:CZB domain-containing protein [Roseicyclus mahoneyensis]|uniref:Chemoreceptor zinc-binding protein n=1 Tax=Roseicyclus mahoneyensis TaxID=164332 RepID=A0A316GPW0_9RHOB|nr:CZB domain-containing protein [Roseicyclus mahoneyensis]PWK62072.1 chemoreceptor zinc-binding protein [Roseicyclus mahoneyensis]
MQGQRTVAETTTRTEITEAIGAHGAWKTRLKAAAMAGVSNLDPARVADNHSCRFGTWLDGYLKTHPNDRDARRIGDLHLQFHRSAGSVAERINAGEAKAALKEIEEGKFKAVTNDLVTAMMEWRRHVV